MALWRQQKSFASLCMLPHIFCTQQPLSYVRASIRTPWKRNCVCSRPLPERCAVLAVSRLSRSHSQSMLTPRVSVVFSGGVALGAYQAGAYATLHDHEELRPRHLAGSSIGAVNAALIAGNTMPKAVETLKMFWDTVALEPPGFVPWFCYAGHWPSKHAYSWLSVLHARLSGRAGVFYPRLPALMFGTATSVYDLSPLGTRLEEFIDFKRLNDGLVRISVVTTDVETGDAVVFDTARGDYIGPNHLLASCGFLPDFSPIEINGRLLGDGGLSANTPVEAVLDQTAEEGAHICFLLDLFSPAGH